MSHKIPARIIQTGKTRDLPLSSQASAANLKCLNPGFEYRFFDDAAVHAFIRDEFPEYREIYENFPYRIQKFDFFRYLAVYRLGGFYFDLDVFLARGLAELLSRQAVFPFEELTINRWLRQKCGMDWEIGNYAFGAAAGHPFLKKVIENCVRSQQEPDWALRMTSCIPRWFRSDFQVLNSTGPGMLTRTLAENPELASCVTVLFPEDVCDESSWHQFGDFGIHAQEGSWRVRGGYLRRRLGNLWEARTMRKLMPQSRAQGKTRSVPTSDI